MASSLHEHPEGKKLPAAFIWRRLHSLFGLWLVIYLCEHLFVNSQAALFFKDKGSSFIAAVNRLESLPYLKAIELLFLAIPFLLHGVWGMYYVRSSKPNSNRTDGALPSLPHYKRNRAYTWERITAWLLVGGIILHVFHMRFWAYPLSTAQISKTFYMVRVSDDRGLARVAEQLHLSLYTPEELAEKESRLKKEEIELENLKKGPEKDNMEPISSHIAFEKEWLRMASKKQIKGNGRLAVSPTIGAAFYLTLRETFKSFSFVLLYSLFVIAAAYHAFQGLWSFMITWGVTLSRRSQTRMRLASTVCMWMVILLGLAATWGTYWTVHFYDT